MECKDMGLWKARY